MSTNIESHLVENRLFKPPKKLLQKRSYRDFSEYEELYRKSIKSPEKFWVQQASELLFWQKNGGLFSSGKRLSQNGLLAGN